MAFLPHLRAEGRAEGLGRGQITWSLLEPCKPAPPEMHPCFRLGLQLASHSLLAGDAGSVRLRPPLGLPASSLLALSRKEVSGMQGWASCPAQSLPEAPHCPLLKPTLSGRTHSPSSSGPAGLSSLASHPACFRVAARKALRGPQPSPPSPPPCSLHSAAPARSSLPAFPWPLPPSFRP